jgi:uncharacterized protein (DUF1697 family)
MSMPTYVAFLRGVNVGEHNIVHKEDLLYALGSLGYTQVSAFKQSGNLIFECAKTGEAKLQKDLEKVVSSLLGKDVEVLLRSLPYLQKLKKQPFQKRESKKLQFSCNF